MMVVPCQFEIESDLCRMRLDRINIQLENACENLFETRIFSEATAVTIFDKIENFFKSIIRTLERYKDKISLYVQDKVTRNNMKKSLRAFYTKMEQERENGKKTVEMMDVWNLCDVVVASHKELARQTKKIAKMNYKHTSEMDADINRFMKTMDEYEKSVSEAMNEKTTVSIDKAIKFVEDQITGHGMLMTTMSDGIREIKEIELEVMKLKDKREIYGADVLPEKISAIRRVTTKFSQFLSKTVGAAVAKLIASVVFLLA